MLKTTVRELKHATSAVLARAEAGEELILTRRGKAIARLGPVRRAGKVNRPDFAARLREIYGDQVLATSATELMAEARGDR